MVSYAKRLVIVASIVALLGLSSLQYRVEAPVVASSSAIIPHDKIFIEGDSEFTNESGVTSGSGTSVDPYIIEGWSAAVSITNTTSYVIMRNMTIMGYPANIWYGGGLLLTNVTRCVVEFCELIPAPVEDFTSFGVLSCSNVTIRNNSIRKYVRMENSQDIIFESNLVVNYNLRVKTSERVDIRDNYLLDSSMMSWPGWAIVVNGSRSVSIEGNYIENRAVTRFESYGVNLESSQLVEVRGNVFINNTCQARDDGGNENLWNTSYPNGGNFWSDYSGVDLFHGPGQDIDGSDGIGDSPYVIDENTNDSYPLMEHPSPQGVDSSPPFSMIQCAGTEGDSGWFVSDITITIDSFDVGSGVNWTKYRIGSEEWKEFSVPFMFSQEGSSMIEWYSQDKSGNTCNVKDTVLDVDRHAPVLVLNVSNDEVFDSGNLTISWSCWDNVSGIDHYDYRLDGRYFSTNSTHVSLMNQSQGIHSLSVFAYDVAGNFARESVSFNVTVKNSSSGILDKPEVILVLAGIGVLVVGSAVALMVRRGRERNAS